MIRLIFIVFILFSFSILLAQDGDTCAYFDGANDYLTTGGSHYNYNEFTTEFWAYATDWTPSTTQILVTLNTSGGGSGYKVELRSSDIRFFLDAGSDKSITISTSSLSSGWHHIAATYDGSEMNLWVDGEINANTSQTGSVDYDSYELRIGTHSDGSDDYDGYIDELRFWQVARSQSEIQTLMHRSGTVVSDIVDVRGYYRFNTGSTLKDEGNGSPIRNLVNVSCSFEDKKTPIGNFSTGYTTSPKALWKANGTDWSEESNGLKLQDYNVQTIDEEEFFAFANNNLTGTTTGNLPTDIDIRASKIWFIDAVAADRINLNFDLSDFGASAVEITGLDAGNYKLLRRTGTSGDFAATASGTTISSGEIFFEDYDLSGTDAYFTIGRDNDLATVTTTSASSISFMNATLGGEITNNGGGTVSEQGICYNKTGTPTTLDIKKKDYTGQNPFTKIIYDLVPNTTYYVRAYAINSEGTSYGSVQSFTTTSATSVSPTGSGTSEDPYQIANLNNLVWMMETESSWDSYFELTSDIDASVTSTWDGGKGFAPLGRQYPTEDQFNGFLEGNNHVISNLYIDRPNTNDVGLFGYTDRNYDNPTSYVRNLGLENVDISGGYRTASLIGRSTSEVSNCYTTGSVTGSASNSVAAGLIGQSHKLVSNCYTTVSVSAEGYAAGFISFNNFDIQNCYSTGLVSNASDQDGFCNDQDGHGEGVTSACFWDTQTSNQASSEGATGKTTAEMKATVTYINAGWDFKGETENGNDDIWNIGNDRNDDYPYLDWQYPEDDSPLPVTLSIFTAAMENENLIVRWKTESEQENHGWNIYRSDDDNLSNSFLLNQDLIPGAGSSSIATNYEYNDNYGYSYDSTYYYWLESVSYGNQTEVFGPVLVFVYDHQEDNHPPQPVVITELMPNYPNPFNPSTNLYYSLGSGGVVKLSIFNSNGQLIRIFDEGYKEQGEYRVYWDGRNMKNTVTSSGIYLLKMEVDNEVFTRKIMMIK